MSYELEGKLHKKFDTESKTPTFQARDFVVELNNGNYPQYIRLQLTQDRCSIIDSVEEGETIKVHFDLRGREWNGKYFTNLNAWKVEKPLANETPAPQDTDWGDGAFPSAGDEPQGNAGFNDQLPF